MITKSLIHPGMSGRPHLKALASAAKRNIAAKTINLIVMVAVRGRLETGEFYNSLNKTFYFLLGEGGRALSDLG